MDRGPTNWFFKLIGGQYFARPRRPASASEQREYRPLDIGEVLPEGVHIEYGGRFVPAPPSVAGEDSCLGNFWFIPLNTVARIPRSRAAYHRMRADVVRAGTNTFEAHRSMPIPATLEPPSVVPPSEPEQIAPKPRKRAKALAQRPRLTQTGPVTGIVLLARMATHLGVILRAVNRRSS